MTIRVTIDRLILDGLPVDRASTPLVRAAVEAELTRLLAAGGWNPAGGAVPAASVSPISVSRSATPQQFGTAIAGAIYEGVTG